MNAQAAYDELLTLSRQQTALASCLAVLGWDEDTYLPPAGVAHRAEQAALLSGMLHDQAADPRLGELLAAVEGSDLVAGPLSPAAVNVRELRRGHDREARLPRPLVEELARVTTVAQQEWAAALRASDWAHFRPWLEQVLG